MQVIPNGIEVDDGQRPHDSRLKAELALPPDSFLIASVGQICLRKGQDVFAQAAALAAAQMPAAHFLLIGERYSAKPESAAYNESIDRTFAAAGLADRFHRLGFRQDVPQLLAEVDLLVHSARQEPLGRVLLEAAAAGCPIVATNVGGTSEMLVDDQSALLVPADNPQALATAMIRAFGDASLRDRLADWARARIATYFSIAVSAQARRFLAESAQSMTSAASPYGCRTGQFRCLCKKANVPIPWIVWGPLKNSISVRSPNPNLS